jgi:hypothetical protein
MGQVPAPVSCAATQQRCEVGASKACLLDDLTPPAPSAAFGLVKPVFARPPQPYVCELPLLHSLSIPIFAAAPAAMRAALLASGTQVGPLSRGLQRSRAPAPLKLSSNVLRPGRSIQHGQQQQQCAPVGVVRSPAANAAASAAAYPLQPSIDFRKVQHLCKSVLIGVAAAAAWSIVASAFAGGAGGPFASLSLVSAGSSSAGMRS